jgi:hypothetical protein
MKRFAIIGRCVGTLGVVCILLALAGCGARTGTVSGTITYQDKPLGNGRVMFINQKDPSKASQALIQPDGSYTATNVPLGPATITVETIPDTATSSGPGGKLKAPPGMDMPGAGEAKGKYVAIPAKYQSKDQSGLTYDVKPGKQEYSFDLK